MKKSLIAFAVLSAFASVASAQSSVVLYGVVDASANYKSNQTTSGGKLWSLDSGSLSASRWGLMGTEALEGGMKVNFKLESTLNVDSGGSGNLFDRQATVGVSTDFGSFDIGRQTNLSYDTLIKVDPLNGAHLGTNPNNVLGAMYQPTFFGPYGASAGARQNNSIKYASPSVPSISNLKFGAMYGFGETAGNTSANSYMGITGGINEAGFIANLAYSESKDAVDASTLSAFAVGFKFVPVPDSDWAIKLTYAKNKVDTTKRNLAVLGFGVDYKASPATTLTAAYYNSRRSGDLSGQANQFALLAKYDLSKRTAAYTSFTVAKAKSTALKDSELGLFIGAGNKSAARFTVGMLHAF